MENNKNRWAGRNQQKDDLRMKTWKILESSGQAIGDPWSSIPDFIGSKEAAERLATTAFWKEAKVVKSNPDRAQAWVRLFALQERKRVYTPVPELTKEFPFLLLDPDQLEKKRVDFKKVMFSEGALIYGQRLDFKDMEALDICVVGSVATSLNGGRIGKGGGFADLEMGIFRDMGILSDSCPIVTTVCDKQVVPSEEIFMESHDTPLDWIVTPTEVIATQKILSRPRALDWSMIQDDQFRNIPFLRKLRKQLVRI